MMDDSDSDLSDNDEAIELHDVDEDDELPSTSPSSTLKATTNSHFLSYSVYLSAAINDGNLIRSTKKAVPAAPAKKLPTAPKLPPLDESKFPGSAQSPLYRKSPLGKRTQTFASGERGSVKMMPSPKSSKPHHRSADAVETMDVSPGRSREDSDPLPPPDDIPSKPAAALPKTAIPKPSEAVGALPSDSPRSKHAHHLSFTKTDFADLTSVPAEPMRKLPKAPMSPREAPPPELLQKAKAEAKAEADAKAHVKIEVKKEAVTTKDSGRAPIKPSDLKGKLDSRPTSYSSSAKDILSREPKAETTTREVSKTLDSVAGVKKSESTLSSPSMSPPSVSPGVSPGASPLVDKKKSKLELMLEKEKTKQATFVSGTKPVISLDADSEKVDFEAPSISSPTAKEETSGSKKKQLAPTLSSPPPPPPDDEDVIEPPAEAVASTAVISRDSKFVSDNLGIEFEVCDIPDEFVGRSRGEAIIPKHLVESIPIPLDTTRISDLKVDFGDSTSGREAKRTLFPSAQTWGTDDVEIAVRKAVWTSIRSNSKDGLCVFLHKGQEVLVESVEHEKFADIRKVFGISDRILLQSICASGVMAGGVSKGKSGSFFYFTSDRRFVLKTVTVEEMKLLQKGFIKKYAKYISDQVGTLLPRYFGFFKMAIRAGSYRFLIMNNCFSTTLKVHQIFDLKGSTVGRSTPPSKRLEEGVVLKDLDFLDIKEKLHFERRFLNEITLQISRDLDFLESQGVMDYSLLVGIHKLDSVPPDLKVPNYGFAERSDSDVVTKMSPYKGLPKPPSSDNVVDETTREISDPRISLSDTVGTSDPKLKGSSSLQTLDSTQRTPIAKESKEFKRLAEMVKKKAVAEFKTGGKMQIHVAEDLELGIESDASTSEGFKGDFKAVFQKELGGVLAREYSGEPMNELYFIGIIDVLQKYNTRKRLETVTKSITSDRTQISAVDPKAYAQRFLSFFHSITIYADSP